jgi:nucleotide-binding universal stress UspA family protein
MGVIVVGFDHSEGAKAALRFALEEARLRHAKLRVVHAWEYGYVVVPGIDGSYPALGGDIREIRDAAAATLNAALRELIPETEPVEIEPRLVEGRVAAALVDESRRADLLVVGSRGYGGFTGLLLGSVSQQCAHHAACPVVIVHRTEKD